VGALTRLAEGSIPIGEMEAPVIATGSINLAQPIDVVLHEIANSMAKDLDQQYMTYTSTIIRVASALPHKAMLYAALVALVTRHNTSFALNFVRTLKQSIVADIKALHNLNFPQWPDPFETVALRAQEEQKATATAVRLPRLAGSVPDPSLNPAPITTAANPGTKSTNTRNSSPANPGTELFTLRGQLRLLAALGAYRVADPVSVLNFFTALLKLARVSSDDLEGYAQACCKLAEAAETNSIENPQEASPVIFMPKAVAVPPPGLRALSPPTESADTVGEPVYVYLSYADAIVYAVLSALPYLAPDICPNENELDRLERRYSQAVEEAKASAAQAQADSSTQMDAAAAAIATTVKYVARPVFCQKEAFPFEDDARKALYRLVLQRLISSIQTYLLIRAELRTTEPGRALGNPLTSFWQDPSGFVKRRKRTVESSSSQGSDSEVEEVLLTDEGDAEGWIPCRPGGPLDALEEAFDAVTGRTVFSRNQQINPAARLKGLLTSTSDADEDIPLASVPCAILAPSIELFNTIKSWCAQYTTPVSVKLEPEAEKDLKPPAYAGSYVVSTEAIAPPAVAATRATSDSASIAAAAATITTKEELDFMNHAFERVSVAALALTQAAKTAFPDLTSSLVLVGTPLLFRPRLGALLNDQSDEGDMKDIESEKAMTASGQRQITRPARVDRWLTGEYAADILIALDGLHEDRIRALVTLPPLSPTPGTGIVYNAGTQPLQHQPQIIPAVGRFNGEALTYVFKEALSFILHPVSVPTASGLSMEPASIASAVRSIFNQFMNESAPRLGPTLNALFNNIALLAPAARARLTNWFAEHIASFDLHWPWTAWSQVCRLPSPSEGLTLDEAERQTLRRLARHPARLFVHDAFERCCNLLYWQKVVYLLRLIGSEEHVKVFFDLCPPPPEPIDVIGLLAVNRAPKLIEAISQDRKEAPSELSDDTMTISSPASDGTTSAAITPIVGHELVAPRVAKLPTEIQTAIGEFYRLASVFESLIVQKASAVDLQAWIDSSLVDCARVASVLKEDPRVHPAVRIVIIAVLRAGAKSLQHAEAMLARCAEVLIKLVQLTPSPAAFEAAQAMGLVSSDEKFKAYSVTEAVVMETTALFWRSLPASAVIAIERLVRFKVVQPHAAVAWMADEMFSEHISPLGVFSTSVWNGIERVIALILQSLRASHAQITAAAQAAQSRLTSDPPAPGADLAALQSKVEVRANRVWAKDQEVKLVQARILADLLKSLHRTLLKQPDVASSIRVRQGISTLLSRFTREFAEVYYYFDTSLRSEVPELDWTLHI